MGRRPALTEENVPEACKRIVHMKSRGPQLPPVVMKVVVKEQPKPDPIIMRVTVKTQSRRLAAPFITTWPRRRRPRVATPSGSEVCCADNFRHQRLRSFFPRTHA